MPVGWVTMSGVAAAAAFATLTRAWVTRRNVDAMVIPSWRNDRWIFFLFSLLLLWWDEVVISRSVEWGASKEHLEWFWRFLVLRLTVRLICVAAVFVLDEDDRRFFFFLVVVNSLILSRVGVGWSIWGGWVRGDTRWWWSLLFRIWNACATGREASRTRRSRLTATAFMVVMRWW